MLLKKPSNLAWQSWPSRARTRTFAHQHKITHRLHAYLWLFKTYVIPAGTYACQVWATPSLQQGIERDNIIQKWLLHFWRYMLGVRTSTPSWSVLRECGIETIQFNWFRACALFYNLLLQSDSPLLYRDFHADLSLSSRNSSCWTAQFFTAMNGLNNMLFS